MQHYQDALYVVATSFIAIIVLTFVQFLQSWYENFCKIPTEKAKFIKDIESVMVRGAKKKGLPKYWTWDQLAVSAALDESIILETKDVWAAVELCGQYTRGQVVIDWRNRDKKPEKITIVTRVDGEKYEKMILSAVK